MLTLKAHVQLSEAMAQMMRQMMRMCVLAATRTWTASVLRGPALWSETMRPPAVRAADGPPAPQEGPQGSFSSYRSGGGHASAQVIVPDADAAPAAPALVNGRLDASLADFGADQRK